MSVYVSTEDAREYIASEHPRGFEVPSNVNFGFTGNHLASAVIFAAMGEPGQIHNLGQLFAHFHVLTDCPPSRQSDSRGRMRQKALEQFDIVESYARLRSHEPIIESLRFELANLWKLDDDVIETFAIDSLGTAVSVMHTGGIIGPSEKRYNETIREVQKRIDREFSPTEQR